MPSNHDPVCACRICARLRKMTAETSDKRFEVSRRTREGVMKMGWQTRAEGGLVESAKLWPGTLEIIVVDRCLEWEEVTPGMLWRLPSIGPIKAFKIIVEIRRNSSGSGAPYQWSIETGGLIAGGSASLNDAKKRIVETLTIQGIL